MSHKFFEGKLNHKRFSPKKHQFNYKFYMIDIDLENFESLKNSLFGINKFNLFSFYSKDHFGNSLDFKKNIEYLLKSFAMPTNMKMRFITLPRILGFVFNPISLLLLLEDNKPKYALVEVHNYNGGRVIYPLEWLTSNDISYKSKTLKDMYVSPFFKRDGVYDFNLIYNSEYISLNITLYEENEKKLISSFNANSIEYTTNSIKKLFFKHTLLTTWVVTRTLYQSIILKIKGLKWHQPLKQDQIRRY